MMDVSSSSVTVTADILRAFSQRSLLEHEQQLFTVQHRVLMHAMAAMRCRAMRREGRRRWGRRVPHTNTAWAASGRQRMPGRCIGGTSTCCRGSGLAASASAPCLEIRQQARRRLRGAPLSGAGCCHAHVRVCGTARRRGGGPQSRRHCCLPSMINRTWRVQAHASELATIFPFVAFAACAEVCIRVVCGNSAVYSERE